MDMEKVRQRALISWLSVGLLAVLCLVLAMVQYRWTGDLSRAENVRLREGLRTSLNRLSRDFNAEIAAASSGLAAAHGRIEEWGREAAYEARYAEWRNTSPHARFIRAIALAVPGEDTVALRMLDLDSGRFQDAEWPAEWVSLKERLVARVQGNARGPFAPPESTLIELPRFGRPPGFGGPGRPGRPPTPEQEWLILDINADYAREVLLPQLIERHLAVGGKQEYAVDVLVRADQRRIFPRETPAGGRRAGEAPDGTVTLFEVQYGGFGPPFFQGGRMGEARPGPSQVVDSGRGRWVLEVRHQAGPLESIVTRARWRNLGISAALLLLILATAVALVRFSRQAHYLAEQQMNFVASVSHELRTPLAVIRTAAYNLRGKIAGNPGHVERYGTLIQQESEKLAAILEQVLRFASAKAGRLVRERGAVAIEALIENALAASQGVLDGAHCVVEKQVEAGLPLVLADSMALQHALQNLVHNAVKYGTEGSNWIGVSASAVEADGGTMIEIRVADRGPGIPAGEIGQVFDPFFRGRRAVQDQIHGTGLGLNLVKRIVEEHGGTVSVHSEPMKKTEFVIRLPMAPVEHQDEFAHTTGRG